MSGSPPSPAGRGVGCLPYCVPSSYCASLLLLCAAGVMVGRMGMLSYEN